MHGFTFFCGIILLATFLFLLYKQERGEVTQNMRFWNIFRTLAFAGMLLEPTVRIFEGWMNGIFLSGMAGVIFFLLITRSELTWKSHFFHCDEDSVIWPNANTFEQHAIRRQDTEQDKAP